ncbi:galactolipase DONGLE, chloroplastic-like [Canna indica]|uniref:Galactolipase DONGLE, chloroplastic-like n=1 Tax=Canna indica TaxID=4628 RepID=A0AAQ3QC61_9LILI|nr:galactolipase DONGLE, chloroplastic-like [Canna indica]
MPGLLLNEKMKVLCGGQSCYAHVGVEVAVDFFSMNNPAHVHDMEAYVEALKCAKLVQYPEKKKKKKKKKKKYDDKLGRFWKSSDALMSFDEWKYLEDAKYQLEGLMKLIYKNWEKLEAK